ncbi:MAG: hypothetical protein IJE78_05420 [Bacteroidaceae bacterium]|nr:hypothetical protein [Bacteroidaceae bacterium]
MNITKSKRQDVVEAGIIKAISSRIQGWLKSLGSLLDKISDWDPENPVKKGSMKPVAIEILPSGVDYPEDQQKQGKYPYRLSLNIAGDDDDYRYYDMAVKPTGGDKLSVQSATNVKVALPDIDEDASEEEVDEAYADFYQRVSDTINSTIVKLLQRIDRNIDDIKESHVIQASVKVNLHKINCSEGCKTELKAITSSLSVPETLEALDAVLSEPDFVEHLNPETDNWYEIVPSDDSYDVEICEECEINICDQIEKILHALYDFWGGCKYLGWTCRGAYSGYVESACEMYAYQADAMINYLSKLHWSYCKEVPYPHIEEKQYTNAGPLDILTSLFTDVIETLSTCSCNFDGPEKSVLDQYLSEFKQYRDYTLEKMKG